MRPDDGKGVLKLRKACSETPCSMSYPTGIYIKRLSCTVYSQTETVALLSNTPKKKVSNMYLDVEMEDYYRIMHREFEVMRENVLIFPVSS